MQLDLFKQAKEVVEKGNTQVCRRCNVDKDISEFYEHISIKTGYDTRCGDCHREDQRLRYYMRKDYAHLNTGFCDCCGIEFDTEIDRGNHKSVLDHCHETTTFRGWICTSCNLGIGKLGDNLEGLKKAINYLERFENETRTRSYGTHSQEENAV
jgi:hypothetical protein